MDAPSFDTNPKTIEARIMSLARYHPGYLPACLVSAQFFCEDCSIDDEHSCLLLHNPDFLSLLRWRVLNLSRQTQDVTSDDLLLDLMAVFESQGSALHIDKILALLHQQNPELEIDLNQLRRALRAYSPFFEERGAGVFIPRPDQGEAGIS